MILRKDGNTFFTHSEQITGVPSNFTLITSSLTKALPITPDTCVIAIFSSHTEDSLIVPGSVIEVDDIWFNRVSDSARVDIPNSSFEDWSQVTFHEPNGWNTSNLYSLDSNNVAKATNSLDNSSAVELVSKPLVFGDTNGILFLGLIDENGVEEPGFSVTSPTKITIDYQYTPQGPDTAVVYLSFSKYNPITKSRVSTGVARAKLVANTTMTTIDIPFAISGPVDSVAVTIASSIDEKNKGHQPQIGSRLVVDNLRIETVTGSFDLLKSTSSLIYPNPAVNQISITDQNVTNVIIINNLGQPVLSKDVTNQSVDINLETGSYIIQLLNKEQQLIKIEKLIIN